MLYDRRKYERIAINREVVLSGDRFDPECCKLRNLSSDGAFIALQENTLVRGTPVQLILTLSQAQGEESDATLYLPSRVAWANEKGAGLKFDDLTLEVSKAILALIRSNCH